MNRVQPTCREAGGGGGRTGIGGDHGGLPVTDPVDNTEDNGKTPGETEGYTIRLRGRHLSLEQDDRVLSWAGDARILSSLYGTTFDFGAPANPAPPRLSQENEALLMRVYGTNVKQNSERYETRGDRPGRRRNFVVPLRCDPSFSAGMSDELGHSRRDRVQRGQ